MKFHSCFASFCSAIAIFLFFGCSSVKEEHRSSAKFPVINPIVTDTVVTNEYVATISSFQFVEVRTKVSGYLERSHVDEGQKVTKGELLFTLGSHEYNEELIKAKAQVKSAIAEAKAAEVDLLNVSKLVEKDVISKSELEIAQSRLDAAQSKVEEARALVTSASLKLSMTRIRAPFSGTIDRIPNKVGSLIEEGTLLTTISDNSSVFAYFNVSEREYLDYMLSDQTESSDNAQLVLANNRLHSKSGRVETVDGRMDRNTGTIAFRAWFPNPDGLLKHGASGKVRISQVIKNAMLIPQKSTFEIQDKLFVYVLDSSNVVHMRSVVPKMRLPHSYIIERGVSADERIIYEGIQLVSEGDTVDPEFTILIAKQ